MKLATWAITLLITGLSLTNPLQEANSTESPKSEKEKLAKEFVTYANGLAAAKENRN